MDIVHSGIIMAVYLFIIIALYIFLSSPFDSMMTSFEDIDSSASDAKVESASVVGRTVFNMIFAGLGIVPMLWFIIMVFRTEPDWRYR
jgi:hypothetical protein